MQRLSGIDASFLYMESPTMHMHILGVIVIDPSTMPGGYSYEKVCQVFRDRLHLLTPFRRRAVFVPFGLDHPVWIEDENFDFDRHVRRIAAPAPGTLRELGELVGHIASIPLDRSRPLWELTVVEGLEHGHVALVAKLHHSSIDGISGADLLIHLVDLQPDAPPVEQPSEPWKGEPVPSDTALVADALKRSLARPGRMVKTVYRTSQSAVGIIRTIRSPDNEAALPLTAPRTQFSGTLTPHRSVSFARSSLDDFKVVKAALGTTVNDVVLAACTESLRRYLIDQDDLPDRPLVASVPVSIRTDDDEGGGNKISAMFASLPVQIEDPVDQLVEIHRRMNDAKELHNAVGADMLQDWSEMFGPAMFAQASRVMSRMRSADKAWGVNIGDRLTVHNVIISNIPGPPMPLYVAGARVVSTYPIGPVIFGAGLNLTVLSNMGNVDISAVGCTELVPEIWKITDGFVEAVHRLREMVERGDRPAEEPQPAPA